MQSAPLVHSKETSGTTPIIPSYHSTRLKHCRLEFTATQILYRHLDDIEGARREEQLLKCRTRAWFVRNRQDDSIRIASNSCRLRWCPMCAHARSNYIRHQIDEWFQTADHPKFLTLTMKHKQICLTDQINFLYNSWRKLRKDAFFRKHCGGGLWFFQICWNVNRHEWHPHIHAIITGKYMDFRILRELWLKYTGDSQILDIRIVRDPKTVGQYVARYAARPIQLSCIPSEQGIEAMTSMHGRRIAGSFGSAGRISFRPKKIADPENWQYLGGWNTVHSLRSTDERAKAILHAYYTNSPLGDGYSVYDVEAFIDGLGSESLTALEIDERAPPLFT